MPNPSRRDILKSMVAAGALCGGPRMAAQGTGGRRRIDVHHHYRVPGIRTFAADNGWTVARSLEQMDKFEIATAMVSPPTTYELYDRSEEARSIARRYNEFAASMVQNHAGRFGFFAAVPLPDREGSLREIEYAFDTLKADGVGMFTDTGKKWPGDPEFDAVFAELNRRKAVVFFHPSVAECCRGLIPGAGDGTLEFDFDTTRAVVSLLVNGTLARYPEVRYIINHSGATIPTLAGRIQDRVPKQSPNYPKGVLYELQKLYYEVAHATYKWPMAALTSFVPTSQILFGTDYPFEAMETTIQHISDSKLSAETWRAIDRANAEKLFPRLKS